MTEFVPPDREAARPMPRRPEVTSRNDVDGLHAAGNRAVTGLVRGRERPVDRHPEAPAALRELASRQLDGDVGRLVGLIGDLTVEQAQAWRSSATRGGAVPSERVLSLALDTLIGGITAVVGDACYSGAVREVFVEVVGRELVEPAAVAECVAGFEAARTGTLSAFLVGRNQAESVSMDVARASLRSGQAGALDGYLAGVGAQVDLDRRLWTNALLQGLSRARTDDIDRLIGVFTLDALHRTLRAQPALLHGAFTAGYLRLLDENAVSERLTDTGRTGTAEFVDGEMRIARDVYSELHASDRRPGTVLAVPIGVTTVGDWAHPQLDFRAFSGSGSGVDSKALSQLAGIAVMDLPLTVGFRFETASPYTRPILGRGTAEVRFSRDPGGTVRLQDNLDEAALEWLGSYHSGISRELTDAERARYAPLGAEKLYAAIKRKPFAGLHSSD